MFIKNRNIVLSSLLLYATNCSLFGAADQFNIVWHVPFYHKTIDDSMTNAQIFGFVGFVFVSAYMMHMIYKHARMCYRAELSAVQNDTNNGYESE